MFRDMAGHGPLWAPTQDGSRHTSTMGELTGTGHALRRDCARLHATLLVVDPLAAAYACNENDRGLVRAFMSDWDGWTRRIGCTVLLVAHPSKASPEYSGSTDWHAAARAVWTLGKEEAASGPETKLACLKTNYSRPPDPLRLHNWEWWTAHPWEAPQRRPKTDNESLVGQPARSIDVMTTELEILVWCARCVWRDHHGDAPCRIVSRIAELGLPLVRAGPDAASRPGREALGPNRKPGTL